VLPFFPVLLRDWFILQQSRNNKYLLNLCVSHWVFRKYIVQRCCTWWFIIHTLCDYISDHYEIIVFPCGFMHEYNNSCLVDVCNALYCSQAQWNRFLNEPVLICSWYVLVVAFGNMLRTKVWHCTVHTVTNAIFTTQYFSL